MSNKPSSKRLVKVVKPIKFICDQCHKKFEHKPYPGINTIRCSYCGVWHSQVVFDEKKIEYKYERAHR